MTVINLKTGKVKTTKKQKPTFCELCGTDIHSIPGGVKGKIGQLPVSFCGICITGIVNMLMEHQNQGR